MKHISNVHFYEYKWYLLYPLMVELVEVAEGVLEPSDHLAMQGGGAHTGPAVLILTKPGSHTGPMS